MDLHPLTRGFEDAARYERVRPDYPPAAVDWLLARLGAPARVLDVGAGTGKLTRALLGRGVRVIAVEPLDGMRAALRRSAPGADVRAGEAERLPLADGEVEAVVAAQAFHWFATPVALAEFARVLTPRGRLGVVFNRRDLRDPVQAGIERLIAPHRAGAPEHSTNDWRAVFTPGAPFVLEDEHEVAHVQTLAADALVERVLSFSFVALLPAGEQRAIAAGVRELAAGAPVALRYVTELFVYGRRGGAARGGSA